MNTMCFRACCVLPFVIVLTILSLGCGSRINIANLAAQITPTQNPLVAQYSVTVYRRGASVWVEFGTDTNYGRQTSATPATDGPWQRRSVLVAGMLPNTTYHMRAHADWDGGSLVDQDHTFTTGAVAGTSPGLTVTRPSDAASLPSSGGVELLDLFAQPGTSVPEAVVADLDGNVIWYYDAGTDQANNVFPIKPLPNGHMVVNVSKGLTGSSTLQEIDLAGNIIRELSSEDLSQRLQALGYPWTLLQVHHDIAILPNGHWIVLANMEKPFTDLPGYPGTTNALGDVLIDLDPDWNPVWVWSTFDHLDVTRSPYFGQPDWTHANAVLFTSNDGNLLLSVRNQSWILKIDYQNGQGTGNILWKLGPAGDFVLTGGDASQWFYSQHYPSIVSIQGSQLTLDVFDNGDFRTGSSGTCNTPSSPECFSRATTFQLDESSRIATLTWHDNPGLYSLWGGSDITLQNGDVEFALSQPILGQSSSKVFEVTQATTPQVVWEMDISGGNAYRAYRIPSLYPGVTWR